MGQAFSVFRDSRASPTARTIVSAPMRPCPRCGLPCPDEAALCQNCGVSLVSAGLGQTFVGHRAPDQAAPQAPTQDQPQTAFKGTMLGIAPLTAAGGPPEYAPPPNQPASPTGPAPGGL